MCTGTLSNILVRTTELRLAASSSTTKVNAQMYTQEEFQETISTLKYNFNNISGLEDTSSYYLTLY
jgi:hypothetical protein